MDDMTSEIKNNNVVGSKGGPSVTPYLTNWCEVHLGIQFIGVRMCHEGNISKPTQNLWWEIILWDRRLDYCLWCTIGNLLKMALWPVDHKAVHWR
jgi:hypothetical protein